jgi:hypothetical protein
VKGGRQYQYENQDRQNQTKRTKSISNTEKDDGQGGHHCEVYGEVFDLEGQEKGDQEDQQQDDLAPWIKTVDR